MFIDSAKIKIKAGDGGNGAVSFRREKYVGLPADRTAETAAAAATSSSRWTIIFPLWPISATSANMPAGRGGDGRGKRCSGKKGEDLVISVPRGTLLRDAETGRLVAESFRRRAPGDCPRRPRRLGQQPFCHTDAPGAELCKARHEGGGA